MIRRAFLASLFALPVLLVPGCRSSESHQSLPMPSQQVEVSGPDVARIYVLRESGLRGRVRSVRVEEAGKVIGAFGEDEYLCWETSPGRILLSVFHEAGSVDGGDLEGVFSLDAAPGHAYYLLVRLGGARETSQRARAGYPEVEVIDPAEGRELVRSRQAVPAG